MSATLHGLQCEGGHMTDCHNLFCFQLHAGLITLRCAQDMPVIGSCWLGTTLVRSGATRISTLKCFTVTLIANLCHTSVKKRNKGQISNMYMHK